MRIVADGKAVANIHLPENPTPRETFAAEELKKYIKLISKAEITNSGNCENTIIIGEPKRNPLAEKIISQKEFDKFVPGPEGFIIKSYGNMLLLAGSSKNQGEQERGTLYAVYEFLERFFGCSLSTYCKDDINAGEFIPESNNIELDDICYVKKCADVQYRTAIVQYSEWVGDPNHKLNEKFISWLAKNRYNRILTWADVYEGYKENGMLKEAEKRGILFSVGHHQAIAMLLPHNGNKYFPEKYSETHPEYYKLLEDGTRFAVEDGNYNGQLILCMRNEELITQMTENVIKWTDLNRQVDVICLWPYDGRNEQCCCEKCKNYSKSENYSYFVNRIAESVSKARPNIKIDKISYLDLIECTDKELSSSMIIDEAVWHSKLRSVGRPDGGCYKDSEFEKNILEWKKTGARVVYYDYLMGIYSYRQKWIPAADEMQAICKRFVELGIDGLGTQMETYNMWNHVFNFYTYGRTAYDTTLSMEDNLEVFSRIFGEGAEYVKQIIRMGEDIVDGQTPIQGVAKYLLDNIDKDRVYYLYEKALEVTNDKRARNNIRLMRMVWRYTDLEYNNPMIEDDGTRPHISRAKDDTGELWYMGENFDSFINSKEGYAIAIPVRKRSNTIFVPDKWYLFE